MSDNRVVVVGGGYAGALAANRLRSRAGVDVALVNPRPEFVERVRLHQFVAGTGQATVGFGSLLGEGVRLVVDSAVNLDVRARRVLLESGSALDYDYLIYAVGSTAAVAPSVPGAGEFAYGVAEFEDARRLGAGLAELPAGAPVTVVGGGLTGVETAAELGARGRAVSLVCGRRLLPSFGPSGRRAVARWLSRLGVSVLEGVAVGEVRRDAVVFADGRVRPSALTVWAGGFGVPGLAAASGLRTDGLGRLLTDETLTSVDDARVVAAGDAAAPSGRALRMSCYAAGPLGAQAADTVLSRMAGTEPGVIDLAFSGACVSLGRGVAVRQLARKDESAVNVYVGGRAGAVIKELTCRFAVSRIRGEAKRPGSARWLKGGRSGRSAYAGLEEKEGA
jgi:NADH:ubiquinone reductase (H+-translocating)